ncbi:MULTISPECIES: hypothetical protein [unclassified Mesorhizobium]|uniref:hypothetical protein n=1 Tax=unclassified Mesorhizobium TaxID=325217 RepID=UPI001FE1E599|nr:MULTISPECIES: hypothetical protein [unclassified Mesorhizobium]
MRGEFLFRGVVKIFVGSGVLMYLGGDMAVPNSNPYSSAISGWGCALLEIERRLAGCNLFVREGDLKIEVEVTAV